MKKTKYNDGQNDLVCGTYYRENGSVSSEYYYLNDKLHRTDGPAYIYYYEHGSVSSKFYCLNGKYHRTDGPARIWYHEDGSIDCEYYCLNGNELTREIRNDRINKALFKGRYVEIDGKLMVAGNK